MWGKSLAALTPLVSFFINTFRNRYFYVGFTLQFPLPAAENIAALFGHGECNYLR